jgi:hypothetical protein
MTRNVQIDHAAAVAALTADPGTWKLVGTYPSREAARSAALRIPRAQRMPSYLPAGAYEAYAAQHEDGGTAVWARYVAGLEVEPRPATMTYRVLDRGSGRDYVGVWVVTVEVAAQCPRCGGPRGKAKPQRFVEDGEWLVVDRWSNPCGHTDPYAAVLAEYRKRRAELEEAEQRDAARAAAAGPAEAGEFTDAVALLNAAAAEVRGLHAKQAAQFLDQRGHGEAARRIQQEIRERRGHMSARQAAQFLAELGRAVAAGGAR